MFHCEYIACGENVFGSSIAVKDWWDRRGGGNRIGLRDLPPIPLPEGSGGLPQFP
jgi:hypothetical protein